MPNRRRTTFVLSERHFQFLRRMARHFEVSQGEALRRIIDDAIASDNLARTGRKEKVA